MEVADREHRLAAGEHARVGDLGLRVAGDGVVAERAQIAVREEARRVGRAHLDRRDVVLDAAGVDDAHARAAFAGGVAGGGERAAVVELHRVDGEDVGRVADDAPARDVARCLVRREPDRVPSA